MYSVPMHWRRLRERYNLLGTRCEMCGRTYFPPRKICPNCRRDGKPIAVKFSGKGKIFTYTVIRFPSENFKVYAPYVMGIVQLDEGPKVTSQIVDCVPEDVHIGMPVEACFRKLAAQGEKGMICYGFKFKPTDNSLKT